MTFAVKENEKMDEITLKLNSPITDEQWDSITDVDFDNTDRIWFSTKHGKEVEFTKIVRCKNCKHNPLETWFECPIANLKYDENRWCWKGERKDGN